MRPLAPAASLVLVGLLAAPHAGAQHLLSTLSGDGLGDRMQFGLGVEWDGETAAVLQVETALGGSIRVHVRMFEREGVSLAFEQLLDDPTAPLTVGFGRSMSVQADDLAIGAPGSFASGFPGRLYVYRRTGGSWAVDQVLDATGTGLDEGRFGTAVKLEGDVLMASAPSANVNPGSGSEGVVVVHGRGPAGWVETQRLSMPGPGTSREFGAGLDVDGDVAVIGAPGHEVGGARTGGAWVFRRTGATWSLEGELLPLLPLDVDSDFGHEVAVEGDVAAVAAWSASAGGQVSAGRVYVFERVAGAWVETSNLTAEAPVFLDRFGTSLGLSQGVLAVGSLRYNQLDSDGEVHVFRRRASGWELDRAIQAPPPSPDPNRLFGARVSAADGALLVTDARAVLGSVDAGDVQLYDLDVDTARFCSSTANGSGAPATLFGDGSRTVASDRFRLRAENVPAGFGLFFHGADRADRPFGAGRLCVDGPSYARSPVVPADGSMELEVDFTAPWGAALLPGATRSFQALFRDGVSGPGFQTSDAVEITFR